MQDYINIDKSDDCIDMNGADWGILLDFYIEKNAPELIDTHEVDAEAGMYAAVFENSPEGEKAAQAMAEIIISLIENEDKLIDFVSEFKDEIDWD